MPVSHEPKPRGQEQGTSDSVPPLTGPTLCGGAKSSGIRAGRRLRSSDGTTACPPGLSTAYGGLRPVRFWHSGGLRGHTFSSNQSTASRCHRLRKGSAKSIGLIDAKRLRAPEEENGRLERLLADTMLDNAGLKDLKSKK